MKHVKHLVFDEADVLFTEDQGFMDELKYVWTLTSLAHL